MTFGLSGAALAGIAVGGATLVSGLAQSNAAQSAAETQAGASQAGIEEQRRQFDAIQKLLAPYVAAGTPALEAQQAFLGLQGPEAERAAIERIRGGETFQALAGQGEEALLQRASATGGLRGGNIQGALAQFRPPDIAAGMAPNALPWAICPPASAAPCSPKRRETLTPVCIPVTRQALSFWKHGAMLQ